MASLQKTAIRTPRITSSGKVTISVTGEVPRLEAYTDISLGGMFIKSLFPEDKGTSLKLDLQLAGLRLRVPAKVIWNRPIATSQDQPPGMGIAFAKLSQPQKKLLYNELAKDLEQGSKVKTGTPPRPDQTTPSRGGLRSLMSRLTGR